MRNFPEFTKKHLCRNLFFDKAKLCRSATSLKSSLKSRCFLVIFTKFLEYLFRRAPPDEGTENWQPKWKNGFQKQSLADFKLGVLKNFVSFTRKHLWKVCNSIKKRLQRSRFLWNLQNSFSGYFWGLTCFQRSSEQKPLRLSAINIISSCKNVFTATKIQKQSP